MKKKDAVVLAVVGYILLFFYSEGWGADWRLFLNTTDEHFYYDAESITHPSEGIVRVWCKQVYTEKGMSGMAGKLREEAKVSYWMDLAEFHCADRKFRLLSSVAYSTDGTRLHSIDEQEPKWGLISPESLLIDILYNILCK